ncbi:myosin light chain kinase, smooth muscle isoform X2 [Coregonus clupeaformis]|uniref:myosin light chain kinase, smooth muscle isoform X2 n=1 Tax=Coregonus clupeaformis TaxID=59861 RepID=UPI001BE0BCE1|nr:myosin light chain kinase, smooth muscle isoform X2 [Coregonus clupeaformis]
MGDVQLVTTTQISKTSLTLGRGSPSQEPPAFTLPPRNARVSPGGTARLDGKVRGHPEPQVTWSRNGKAVIAGERFVMEQSNRGTFSLVVHGVQEEDAGRYTCEAGNDAGSRQVTVEITVEGNTGKKYSLPSSSKTGGRFGVSAVESMPSIWGESPPKFVTKPSRIFVRMGQSGKFSAKITGRPQPLVTWLKGDEELHTSSHFNMFEKSGVHFLEIQDVCEDDAGMYTCSVANSAGKATATAELNVQGSGSEAGILGTFAPVAPVPKTTDSPEVKHTSNGLLADRCSPTKSGDRTETRETRETLTRETKDSTELTKPTWKTTVASPKTTVVVSPKPPADLPDEAPRKPGVATPKAASSTSLQHHLRGQGAARTSQDPHSKDPERDTRDRVKNPPVGVQSPPQPSPEPTREARRQARESRSARAAVTAGAPPKFDSVPQSQDTTEGTKVTFKCQVSGSPVPGLSWVKDGFPLRPRAGLSFQHDGNTHILTVDNVQKRDSGTYGCTIATSTGKVSSTWTLTVKNPRLEGKPPAFSTVLKGCSVSEGQDFLLQCSVEGKPLPNISWLLNDKPMPHAHFAFENGLTQLTVKGALPEDEGQYTCVAENIHGRAVCTSRVIVKAKKSVKRMGSPNAVDTKKPLKPSAPVFLRGLKDLKVMDGSKVIMTVEVTGNPHPEIVWLHNGKEIQESEDFHFERKGSQYSLFIQEVFPEDTGKYTCEVWNEVGEVRTEASLTVQEPQDGVQPWFITKPKSTTASLGQNVLLSCAIAGDPFPQWTWMKQGQVVTTGLDYEILQKEDVVSLLIRRVRSHHAGDYEISLRNKVGDCSCVATLLVSEGAVVSGGEQQTLEPCQRVGGVDGTVRGRGAPSSSTSSSSIQQQQEPVESEEPSAARGLLKRRVETKEHCEDQIRLQEAEQRDFRTVLGRKVTTKSVSEEDLKEITAEQMDFRSQLQPRGVKPKTLSEDERKVNAPAQVDFRAVLGKKGGAVKPGAAPAEKGEPADFRSVLANKKKQTSLENNGESPAPAAVQSLVAATPKAPASSPDKKEKEKNTVNCVDGGIIDKKNNNIGKEPVFSQKLSDVSVVDGSCLRLQCQVTCDPPATTTWTLDGKVIKPSKFIKLSNEGGQCSLTIDKALPEDEGQYKCRAENSAGKAECSCMVLVDDPTDTNSTAADKKIKKPSTPTSEICAPSVACSQTGLVFPTCGEARIKKPNTKMPPKQAMPPQIVQFPDDMKILAGEKVEILCKFGGAPPINCTWLKFRKPIQEVKGDLTIETTEVTSKLTIADSQQDHCGCYTIELRNNYGLRQAALNLTIVDKPDPPARVPAASDIRRSTLTLSWYGPTYDGGSAVQSYNLEIWNSVDKEWKNLVSCNSTSYNVQNLLGQRQYKFRVRAVNIYGIGEPSAESEPVTMLEEDVEDKDPDYRDVTVRTDVKVKDLYDVEERLGTGKFGQVFKLLEKATKKHWAGKFIKAYSAKEKDNVRQEIAIMNSLHHPKLVQCIDAFEGKSDIVMVLEMISGGELFERIIDEDFELTEREVIKYMLQIVDGVHYIHKQGIVHLDLKPENIMCVNKTGSTIKLIDFGLARRLESSGTLKVLFGTPEFVAPEVINYEAISYPTDMWSIGVICYILVSGLSPFMGDNDNETLSNVTSATWDFEDDAFDEISDHAKDFITNLLKKDMRARLTCDQCYEHPWLKQDTGKMEAKKLSKERMKKYILRRKWQKTGHAVRAIGRLSSMAMLAGVSAKKGSPTEEDNQFLECLEYEEKTQVKPTFSSVIKDVEVVEGSAARFDCKIEGYPDPEVVWYKDEQPIKETRHFQIDYDEEGNCSLVISEVNGDDDAKYTVKAVNSLGEATCTAELLVEVMAEEEEEEEEEEE